MVIVHRFDCNRKPTYNVCWSVDNLRSIDRVTGSLCIRLHDSSFDHNGGSQSPKVCPRYLNTNVSKYVQYSCLVWFFFWVLVFQIVFLEHSKVFFWKPVLSKCLTISQPSYYQGLGFYMVFLKHGLNFLDFEFSF